MCLSNTTPIYNYLNFGTGYACAGQSNGTLLFCVTSVISITFVATFGAALPTGSTKKFVVLSNQKYMRST